MFTPSPFGQPEKKMEFLTPSLPSSHKGSHSHIMFASPPLSASPIPHSSPPGTAHSSQPIQKLNPPLLRQLVNDLISKHMYPSATFFADKLTTVSKGEPDDIYLLAQCLFFSKQYRRAVHLLRTKNLLNADVPGDMKRLDFFYLGALCLSECCEWDECLAVLGENETNAIEFKPEFISSSSSSSSCSSSSSSSSTSSSSSSFSTNVATALSFSSHQKPREFHTPSDMHTPLLSSSSSSTPFSPVQEAGAPAFNSTVDLRASISLLRGKIYEALENRQRAIVWYKHALKLDVQCYEALEHLVEKRMLNYDEERSLLAALSFPPHLQWLKLVYETKLQQYDQSCNSGLVDRFHQLETEYELTSNLDLLAGVAEHHYNRNDFRKCYQLSKIIIEQDPYHHAVLPSYLCSLVELEMKSELFYCAHQLVEAYPDKAVSWFSVACYYYLIGKFVLARRYFNKSTTIDHHFAPGWIGFGYSV